MLTKIRFDSVLFILALFFVIFSLVPTVYEIVNRDKVKPVRSFELVHNFYTDYNFYLSRIRQGIEGNLTVTEKYTSEPHAGSFIHIFYVALGWLGAWNRVPWERSGDVYHMARIILALTLLLVIAQAVKSSFDNRESGDNHSLGLWQLTAFLLAVTASTYPKLVTMDDGSLRIGGYMPWWSVMDSLQRITFLPHLLAGQALIGFMLLALSNQETMAKWGNWLFLGFLGFILGIIFPPGILFVLCALPVLAVIESVFIKSNSRHIESGALIRLVVPKLVVAAISIPALIYLQLMTSFFPWRQLSLADILHPLPFDYKEYFLALGPVFPVGLAGLIRALVKRDEKMAMSAAWVITWMALLVIFKFIPQQSPLRFSEMVPHVPLGILSAYLFYQIYRSRWYEAKVRICKRNWNQESGNKDFKHSRLLFKFLIHNSIFLIPLLWIILNLWHMQSSYLWQRDFVDHKLRADYPLVPTGASVMYPLRDFISAIKFIQDNSARNDIVLADFNSGNYIPVYSGNTVYIGHDNTVNKDEKAMYAKSFYSGVMGGGAEKWLRENNIKIIFFGPLELDDAAGRDLIEFYPFLKEVYKNEYVKVYRLE